MNGRRAWGAVAGLVAALAVALVPASALGSPPAAGTAANFSVAHDFDPGGDARTPTAAGVIQAGDGRIYGVGGSGGSCTNGGAIWSSAVGGSDEKVLHSFLCDDQNNFVPGTGQGYDPDKGGVVDGKDGWFYGTTLNSYDSSQAGQVWRVNAAGQFQVVHAWAYSEEGGYAQPSGRLLLGSDGDLYGVTFNGGSCRLGSIYRIDPSTLSYTRLYSFCHTSGADDVGTNPVAGLVEGSDGALYGTTARGGSGYGNVGEGNGTVFKFTPSGNGGTLHTLHSFGGYSDGDDPEAALYPASGGGFYGT